MKHTLLFMPVLSLALCTGATASAQLRSPSSPPTQLLDAKARSWLQDDHAGFVENKGQLVDQQGKPNPAVRYLLDMPGLNVQLRATGFSYDTWADEKGKGTESAARRKFHRVDIALEGANRHARLIADQPMTHVDNVINGNGSYENIRSYKKVTYRDIYPGIDLEFVAKKGSDKPVEYNFIVHPGADASQIRMKYNSGSEISLKDGMIEMDLAFGKLKEKIPASYTQQDGRSLAVQYKPMDEAADLYAFNVPDYDHNKTLVIDPTPSLVWSTYYGGNMVDQVQDIATDAAGNIYISGISNSTANIATAGTYQTALGGGTAYDFFMAKFTASGTRLWGTYVGGTGLESPTWANTTPVRVATDGSFAYLVGSTPSTNLASPSGVHQSANAGGVDVYLGKFNASNGTLSWATYYGGAGDDQSHSMFLHPDGSIYLSGITPSAAGIATAGTIQTVIGGGSDGFAARFTSSGALSWGTYLGGTATDRATGLVADAAGNVYITGVTGSNTGIATAGSFQPAFGGANDIFLMKLNSTGTVRTWGTYWGGSGAEWVYALKMNPSGDLILAGNTGTNTGTTAGSAGMASPGALNTSLLGNRDALVAKFDLNGNRIWSTYYGGTGHDICLAADLDENGNIIIIGDGFGTGVSTLVGSPSAGLATNCTYQNTVAGANEVFVTKIAANGSSVLWSTYFGGPADDRGHTVKYLGSGNFLIGGATTSTSGIASSGAHQTTNTGHEGFLARFTEGMAPSDVMVTTTSLSPMSQTSCALGIPAVITGNAVSLYNPPGFTSPIFYQWQVADAAAGPWTNIGGEVFRDLQPMSSQTTKYYRRLVMVNNGYCDTKVVDSSAVATVTINANTAPIANADGPQWYVCGSGFDGVTLNGSATGGSGVYSSYQWYAGSNLATPAFTGATYAIPAVTATTTYTLKVTDNAGCIDIDQVTVVPAIANAGPDVNLCENSGGVQIGTPGTPGGAVTYSWTPATGLSCTNCAQPVASPTATTNYQLTTTVTRKDNTTCSTTDNVTVAFVTAPTGGVNFAGTDKTICKNTSVQLGGVNDASATYSWSPTSYLDASNIYNPTFSAGTNTVACPTIYTVTAAKSGCSFTDQVNVSVIDAATSLDNQTLNCGGWSYGNTNNCSGAAYTWELISGPGVVPAGASLTGGGASAYLVNNGASNAVYRRKTTMNGVDCYSGNITIAPCAGGGGCPVTTIEVMTPQGCPKVFGQQELQLRVSGINAADYNFSWTPANIMSNPTAAVVTITSTAATTVNVTVTNKYTGQVCTIPALAINNPSWSLPVLNVSDKSICPGTPSVNIGEAPAAGFNYVWTPTSGLNSAVISDPAATVTTSTNYAVVKIDANNGCKTTDNVTVSIANIDFDAGPTRSVCNGATVTLGTTPGGSYTYNWTPAGAAWTNGTGPTNANPQVLFASGSQTFNVTVTDPVTSCQKLDAVTLNGTTTPGEYAGAPVGPICPGETVQIGADPVLNATYSWSPATGLSCTTCANPVVTAGTSSQVYTVTVSYPGCTIPTTDNVTVSVHSLPTVTLTDKNICSTTPTNIGIGGAGNTASLADVSSYNWTPATGLSCTGCASPNANPVIATTYNVAIAFTNGCMIQRSMTVTPTVTATAKPDATVCPGGSIVLGSPAVADVTYTWSILSGTAGSINPTNAAQPTANPTATTVYRLTATGTGPNAGCTVTVKTLPAFNISGTTAVCAGGAATLSVSPAAQNTIYQWSPAATVAFPDSATTTVMPAVATTYRVTQTDVNSGCSDYKEVTVTVWPNNVTATGGAITVCPSSSEVMPLTVSPATGNTISWSPAASLSNPFAQNPVVTPLASGSYIATVINTTSNCSDTALVTVNVPASCLAYDFGDAPVSYEAGNPARHGILATLKIGAATDAEGTPVSAALNAPATGDDGNNTINDEEGISVLPAPNTASQSLGLIVNNVLNNTGKTAYLAAWIDFNRDGDFNDAGERSQILPLADAAAPTDPVLQFSGFNTGCLVQAGMSYLRVRLTTDTAGAWNENPSSGDVRADGEVEDYTVVIMGSDFGDAPVVYPISRALVNPDLDANGEPDSTGSVWLGAVVDYPGCNALLTSMANGDDTNGMDDEDGLMTNGQVTANTTGNWTVTVNSQGPVNDVKWGMWIDWDANGSFEVFYTGSVNTASPTPVTVPVAIPAAFATNYVVRLGVKTGDAFTSADHSFPIGNGEWEDYIGPSIPLNAVLLNFTAVKQGQQALLQWQTASEEHTAYFNVERSNNGIRWARIGRTTATGSAHRYELTDPGPQQGINYYRLATVAADGSYKLSPVRQLNFGSDTRTVTAVPNPANGTTTVLLGAPVRKELALKLTNSFGQLVATYIIPAGSSSYPLSVEGLARGVYYLNIDDATGQIHLKLIVQ